MKALTKTSPTSGDLGEIRDGFLGKYGSLMQPKDESNHSDAEENNNIEASSSQRCHICLKLCHNLATLKSHVMSDHRDILSAPALSPYKMMSPVRKLSTESNNPGSSQKEAEDYGGSNMCGTCGKSFRDPQSLKFHRYNHVLRYQCNYCGKRFSRSWNLHRHRKTHYRQLQEAGLGSDEVHPIDVDNESANQTPTYEVDKDLILTSPYADYRNHRHDMMPFAFDMRKSTPACTYGINDSKDTDEGCPDEDKSVTEKDSEDITDKEQTKADP